jgi:subtilisin family serine protease
MTEKRSPSLFARLQRPAIVLAFVTSSALGLRGSAAEHHALLSSDLFAHQAKHTTFKARVIIPGTDAELDALAYRHKLQIVRRLEGAVVLYANSAELEKLAADASVDHLSGDAEVRTSMSVSNKATAADQVWAGKPGLLLGIGSISGVTGAGIVVAVVDSGISPHSALANKVVANVSFVTGDPAVTDAFGHGTHVAGIIAGSGSVASSVTPLYTGGIAPGVKLVNVRVLGANGTGLTSDVIAGINWAISNRTKYNIRVINLSLGHPVFERSSTDPLCVVVQKAVNAGIVVVASAGNSGKSPDGRTVLGSVTSPGNTPGALTVGALNTWGTIARSDDSVTTYSSRGPTRYDNLVKPDVAAPGNKIISLQAAGSYLPATYPFLHKAGTGNNSYMQLSGTSMAAPMVSGAVALLLQGTPSMSAAQVKLAMQSGATYVTSGGLMGAGAGSADFWSARQAASSGLVNGLVSSLIGGLLSTPSGASFWDDGSLSRNLYAGTGIRLLSLLEAPLVWLNPSLLKYGNLNLVGLLNPLRLVAPKMLQYGQIGGWTNNQQIIWGDTIYDPQGQQIIWGDADYTDDNQIIWGDAVLSSSDPQ